jgi:Chemotaxis phosphatase CheX
VRTSQYVLLVSPSTLAVTQLADAIAPLDMVVKSASSYESGRLVAERVPSLSLVVIDATSSLEQASALLQTLKDQNRRLPILWVGAQPSGAYAPDEQRPTSVKLQELSELAQQLMFDDIYPPGLVRALVSACELALTGSFDCAVECAEPRLSRSAVRPGNITALMTFGDKRTTAHCMLSGEQRALSELASRLLEPSATDSGQTQLAVDLASELVNQIVGRLKATSELFSGVRLALPYVITGDNLHVHAPTPKPSLAVQLDVNSTMMTVDLWVRSNQTMKDASDGEQVELF